MLQTYTFSQAQGATRQIDAKGVFFRYESGSAGGLDDSIRIRADGNDLGLFYPGDDVTLPVPCSRWEIIPVSTGASGVVRVGMGQIKSGRLAGNVRVVDEISMSVVTTGPTLATGVASNLATTLVSPALNVAGMLLRSVSIGVQAGAGGTVNLRLIASTLSPVNPIGAFYTLVAIGSNGTNYTETSLWDLKKRIPPGMGLYAFQSITVAAAAVIGAIASYELQ